MVRHTIQVLSLLGALTPRETFWTVNVADSPFPRDDTPAPRAVEAVLISFLSSALGFKLLSTLQAQPGPHGREDPEPHSFNDEANPRGWRAWETDRGAVRAYAEIDAAHSRRSGMLVVFIEWWLPPKIHHAGWWRCDAKRPQEWTKGRG